MRIFAVSNRQNKKDMKYPIGIQDFESLRKDGYSYVDKTALIYKLVTEGRYYFLSRPRRFGKSLLVSTLSAYFEGKRELFDSLAIATLEKEWVKRPVLHLDLNTADYQQPGSLVSLLNNYLLKWERLYGKGEGEDTLPLRFLGVIERAAEQSGHRVAILVDEYDKPLLQTLDNAELQKEFRNTMKAFYSVCKTQDRYIKLALFTGVTKFSKVSVFSDLNNLKDISMDLRYTSLCGVTEEELHRDFDTEVEAFALANGMTKDECYARLKRQYDGYHFCEDSAGVYNPFSLLNALDAQRLRNYWFETGTPTFLVEVLQKNDYALNDLTSETVGAEDLTGLDTAMRNPVPLIYQSGYLTIKSYDAEFEIYHLGYPNKEVEEGFANFLLPYYTPLPKKEGRFFVASFVEDLRKGNVQGFMTRLQAIFADGSYTVQGDRELYFQNCMAVILKMLGFYVEVERTTSDGRIDVTIQTRDHVYIMELKRDGTADEAIQQIRDKRYADAFLADSRTLHIIGIAFSSDSRRLQEWKADTLSEDAAIPKHL